MLQPTLFSTVSLTVTDITRYLRQVLESDEILRDVWVRGEVSNLSRPASGHIYFTLKDINASLRCVMWKTSALKLRVDLRNGLEVDVHGNFSLYERDGVYQLYADNIRYTGEGALYQQFLELKASLEAEGLFDEARKRTLPDLPAVIGVVTSATGAALQDVLNTLRQRYTLAEVVIAPATVQGDEAPRQVVRAIETLNRKAKPDVILVVRGGGSLEDLWAFNDPDVVRAIAASAAPIVTGIGHETDFTLADFAADLRAPTPTGAAALATPESSEILAGLLEIKRILASAMEDLVNGLRTDLVNSENLLRRSAPVWMVANARQRLDQQSSRLNQAVMYGLNLKKNSMKGLEARLGSLSPLEVLKRGYAVVFDREGRVVRSRLQVSPGADIRVKVSDGEFEARVGADSRTE
ncbi:MAG: exodeoxyribonuclease VII large subunit [Anaerolineaceae bacterium]